ncbi:unnamed protein product [Soboliphyme baturini]|uniref:Zf-C2HC5 domain-containing protein n=1 Tax=Soboliphyme baturini TaxID=241478 RepID=A0A183I9Z1_9BILA|nr:unnamed protein product [Soboliphyme baturini]
MSSQRDEFADLEMKYGGDGMKKKKRSKMKSADRYALVEESSKESTGSSRIGRKKTVTVDLEDPHQLRFIIPGRVKCDCQASAHGLVNNCLSCGRIVCEQEGSGPCFFCGSLVTMWFYIFCCLYSIYLI